jgi:hypothetical protein
MAHLKAFLELLNHRRQAVIRILIHQNDLDINSALAEDGGEKG